MNVIKKHIGKFLFYSLLLIILPILWWLYQIIFHKLDLSFNSIYTIHKINPIIFIVDLMPFIISFITVYIGELFNNQKKHFESIILSKELVILRNLKLANKFEKGNFEISDTNIDTNDILQSSLLKMRENLLTINKKEDELNWISKGKELVSNTLRMFDSIDTVSYEALVIIIKYINVLQGAVYVFDENNQKLINVATYAYNKKKFISQIISLGEGLIGQSAFEMGTIHRTEIPEDYVTITSGLLGDQKPNSILIVPLICDEKLIGVIEFASLEKFKDFTISFVEEVSFIFARTIQTLKINTQTKHLLQESQKKAEELKRNENVLKQNAEELELTKETIERTNKDLNNKIIDFENSQKKLHKLLINASEVISIYDENGIVKYESPSVEKILGYKAEDIIGKNGFERIKSETKNVVESIFNEVLLHPWQTPTAEFLYHKRDGSVIWLETTARNMLNDSAINGIILNTRDITQNKLAIKEQRKRSQMQSLSENSPDIIMRFGLDGKIFYVNQMLKYYTNIENKNIINEHISNIGLDFSIVDFFITHINILQKNKNKLDIEFDFPTIYGSKIMMINSIPEFNENNELDSILFVLHDITERKLIEIEINEKNKKITESINYAKHIQTSILPNAILLQENFKNSFIFYKPKDVVSGDFPWLFKKDNYIYTAVVDCTGHGVPGAMLSLIGYFLLNNIVDKGNNLTPSQILDELHIGVRSTLKQEKLNAKSRDGMDIALLKLNILTNEIDFSGAHRPLLIITENKIKEIKGNKKAIGGIPLKGITENNFTNYSFILNKNDKLFIFSDGLTDQFGGKNGYKYSIRRVREMLEVNKKLNLDEISNLFTRDFNNWTGKNKQIDDVLLLGIEI